MEREERILNHTTHCYAFCSTYFHPWISVLTWHCQSMGRYFTVVTQKIIFVEVGSFFTTLIWSCLCSKLISLTAWEFISLFAGMRKTCDVLIYIDIKKALEGMNSTDIYMSQAMKKCVLCHIRTTKAKSACASAQSDQHLCCSLLR